MQVLWREVFGGDRPLIVDEFLFYYKPSEINQSLSFYQFTARGTDCRLIKSLVSSNRNWKTKFFFVSRFQAGNPIEVDKDTFPPYTSDLGNLSLEGFFYFFYFLIFFQLLDDHLKTNFTMTSSIELVFTLTGVSIHWLPFNVVPGGDLVLNHLLKPLLTRLLFVDMSFFLLRIYMSIICYTLV